MQNILKNSGLVLLRSSNYNYWQYEQFHKYIGKRVLEIGCGLGNLTQYLLKDSNYLLSLDIKPEAIDFVKQRFPERKNFHIRQIDVFKEGLHQYSNIHFDTIVLANVLEHIKDDLKAMRVCYAILHRAKGKLLLLVPAHRFLYGTLDKEAGHYRRYEIKDMMRLADQSNFKIIDLYAFNFIGALGWYINYCLLKKRNTNNSETTMQIGLYDRFIVKPSRLVENWVRPKIGISYIAILEARK